MSYKIILSSGASQFFGNSSKICSQLESIFEPLLGPLSSIELSSETLDSLQNTVRSRIKSLLPDRVYTDINERSTRLKSLDFEGQSLTLNLNDRIDRELFEWHDLLNLIQRAFKEGLSIKVQITSDPF